MNLAIILLLLPHLLLHMWLALVVGSDAKPDSWTQNIAFSILIFGLIPASVILIGCLSTEVYDLCASCLRS